MVDKLEKKNLLKRKPCPKDRRITYATITEEGTKFMDDVFPKHKQAIKEIFAGLDVNEKKGYDSTVKKN